MPRGHQGRDARGALCRGSRRTTPRTRPRPGAGTTAAHAVRATARAGHARAARRRPRGGPVRRPRVPDPVRLLHLPRGARRLAARIGVGGAGQLRHRGDRAGADAAGADLQRGPAPLAGRAAGEPGDPRLRRHPVRLLGAGVGGSGHRIRLLRLGRRVQRDAARAVLGAGGGLVQHQGGPAAVSGDHARRAVRRPARLAVHPALGRHARHQQPAAGRRHAAAADGDVHRAHAARGPRRLAPRRSPAASSGRRASG